MSSSKSLLCLAAVGALTLTTQCHSGGGGAALKGNAAFRAAAVSAYQSLGAGAGYPYAALKVASPEGAGPLGGASQPLGTGSVGIPTAGTLYPADSPGALTLVPALNLYAADASFNGDVVTLAFFSDSAGAQPAGSVVVTLPPSANGSVDFTSYPDQVKVAINITGGSLPSTGNVLVTFTGASGANTMTGSLTIKSAIKLDLDLTLSDALDVGGSITVTQNGEVMKCANVTGAITDDLTCDLTVAPYGWTGTGTFNLLTGQMTLKVNMSGSAATAGSDGNGGLILGYSDGTSDSIADADDAPLSGSASGSDGGSDGGRGKDAGMPMDGGVQTGGTYGTTGQAYASIIALNNMSQILGTVTPVDGGAAASVFAPSLAALATSLGSGRASGMNNLGQIVGVSADAHAIYWATPSDTPTTLSETGFTAVTPFAITDDGQIIGRGTQGTTQLDIYWATPTSMPAALMKSSDDAVPFMPPALGVSDQGQIVGYYYSLSGNNYHLLYWPTVNDMPTVLPNIGVTGAFHMNHVPQIIGDNYSITNCIGPNYLSSLTAQPITLPASSNDSGCGDYITFGINNKGLIVGTAAYGDLYHQHAVYWKNGQIGDLNDVLPSGLSYYLQTAVAVNDSGQIACTVGSLPDASAPGDAPFVIVTLQ